ncbi:MAG TPA: hypothetical protein VHM02_14275 [Thermoanaerobaculia bacterium]|nr:hypothetical protein [Thermoanaerobaculia bacterium]
MSRTEARRLVIDLAAREDVARELAAVRQDPDLWRRRAAELGYRLDADEAVELLARREELEDEDLEQVAGGWDDDGTGENGDGTGTGTGGTDGTDGTGGTGSGGTGGGGT